MSEQKSLKYRLFAVLLTQIKAEQLNAHEYSLVPYGRNYALIYCDKELQEPYRKLPEDIELTEQERQWLIRTKLTINKNYLDENADEITPILENLADELQKALSEEAEKLKTANDNKPTPKYKVGDTVYTIRRKGIGATLEEANEYQIFELKIKRIYSGKKTITYYFAKSKYSLGEKWLYATREQAEERLKELQEKRK